MIVFVYVVEKGEYEYRHVAGVYADLETAMRDHGGEWEDIGDGVWVNDRQGDDYAGIERKRVIYPRAIDEPV